MKNFCRLADRPTRKMVSRKNSNSGMRLRLFNFMILTIIVISGSVYLIEVNSLATKGYQIKELESKIADLKNEKSDLEIEVLSLQSISVVREKIEGLGLVSLEKSDYLRPTPVARVR